ncbi:hypothetical protein QJQ45_014208 [Haematococcus lacustris]|nr:hypothetical protein QJQ45_014208 [Haematococcus lacustris]
MAEMRETVQWFAAAAATPTPACPQDDANAALILPPSLSKEDRPLSHTLAEGCGLQSHSRGVEATRFLTPRLPGAASHRLQAACHASHAPAPASSAPCPSGPDSTADSMSGSMAGMTLHPADPAACLQQAGGHELPGTEQAEQAEPAGGRAVEASSSSRSSSEAEGGRAVSGKGGPSTVIEMEVGVQGQEGGRAEVALATAVGDSAAVAATPDCAAAGPVGVADHRLLAGRPGSMVRHDVSCAARTVWLACQAEGGAFLEYSQGEVEEMLAAGRAAAARHGPHSAPAAGGAGRERDTYAGLNPQLRALMAKWELGHQLLAAVEAGDEEAALKLLRQEPSAAWVRQVPSWHHPGEAAAGHWPGAGAGGELGQGPGQGPGQEEGGADVAQGHPDGHVPPVTVQQQQQQQQQQQGGPRGGGGGGTRHANGSAGREGVGRYGPYPVHLAVSRSMKRLVAALAALPVSCTVCVVDLSGVVEQRDAAFLTPLKLAGLGPGSGAEVSSGGMQRQTDLAELATLLLAAGARDPANASSSATALQGATLGGRMGGSHHAVHVALGPPPPVALPASSMAHHQASHSAGKASKRNKHARKGSKGVDASGAEVSGDDTGAMDAGSHTPDEHTGNGVGGDHAAAAAAELEAAVRASHGFTFGRGRSWAPGEPSAPGAVPGNRPSRLGPNPPVD